MTQGEGVTDAKGALAVTFTADKGTRGYAGDYAYTVKADVVDSSRRQISGEGILHVTNQAFYAYLNIPNGFYQRGDKVQVELRTQNADQQPVSVTGAACPSFARPGTAAKLVETVVHTQDLTTDADGKAFTTWQTRRKRAPTALSSRRGTSLRRKSSPQAPVWVAGRRPERAPVPCRRHHAC